MIQIVDGAVPPFLWASWQGPRIVLPYRLTAALEADGVRLVIKHELSHYARRDHWTMTFAAIVAMLFWWNPVVWWARRELRILQESCCDRMVLAQDISQRVRYAEVQRQIESAVREEKLSRDDAEKRLIDARRKIFKD